MIFGYCRVSSKQQNEERQIDALKQYCRELSDSNIYIDKQSGKNFERSEYQKLKEKLRAGDTLIIKEMDRLGRNKQGIKEELEYYKQNNIRIKILDVPTTLMDLEKFGEGIANSMLEMINNVLIEVLGTIAEEERIKIRKRQAEGIAIAKANGKYTGRKSITINELPKEFGKLYKQWKQKKITATQFKSLLNLKSRTTLYKYIKIYETGL